MAELARIKQTVQPHETLLVVDAMTGQEAANLTRTFHEQIGITGAILNWMEIAVAGRHYRCGGFRSAN